jgi:hypothetical protein
MDNTKAKEIYKWSTSLLLEEGLQKVINNFKQLKL